MKYYVRGRVMPERSAVSFSRMKFAHDEDGIADVSCDSSQLSILIDSPKLAGHLDAKLSAQQAAGIIINALGYTLGCGYTAEITEVTSEDGNSIVFGVAPRTLNGESQLAFTEKDTVFNRALFLSSSNIFFRFAVRDYLRAMLDEIDCAYYCYRAIESIKSAFDNETTLNGWTLMHEKLGTNALDIKTIIKNYADPIRHGNWIKIKDTNVDIRWEILTYTKNLLDKYLTYCEATTLLTPLIDAE